MQETIYKSEIKIPTKQLSYLNICIYPKNVFQDVRKNAQLLVVSPFITMKNENHLNKQ